MNVRCMLHAGRLASRVAWPCGGALGRFLKAVPRSPHAEVQGGPGRSEGFLRDHLSLAPSDDAGADRLSRQELATAHRKICLRSQTEHGVALEEQQKCSILLSCWPHEAAASCWNMLADGSLCKLMMHSSLPVASAAASGLPLRSWLIHKSGYLRK